MSVTLKPSRTQVREGARRQAILDVAARSFLKKGYAATSMSAISSELGGSKGTLWRYFPSKAALFTAVVDDLTTVYRRELEASLKGGGDMRATIERFCFSLMTKITSRSARSLNRLAIAEAARFPEIGLIFYDRGPRMILATLAKFLAEQIAHSRLSGADPLVLAKVLSGLCTGAFQFELLYGDRCPDSGEIAAEAAYVTSVFLTAFAPSDADQRHIWI